ncbi:DUF6883 domain-containing protein [Methylobacterium nonmethylotrophicum]|uniref:DUF6883 domain-containing protein n=1 Tax=Methylobacterium nonmethylotrophicum TaxID=1141884 RepID=A0A4Z0NMX0_9HYPH|nr:DUF6883 domain-containing protein [Methylobacterium nonmethylotrophicum]TGD97357.1 hypothetical protein EU555_19490 [Methylobacterium nonmethylotrophicum]
MTDGPPPGTTFRLDSAKITEYLLRRNHPAGKSKAGFFLRFGFSPADPAAQAEALLLHPSPNRLTRSTPSVHGMKHIYEGSIQAPDGRAPSIRTI